MASALAKKLIGEAQGDPPGPLHDPDQDLMREVVGQAVRPNDEKEMSSLVKKALKPFLKVTFLDGKKETIYISLKWTRYAFLHGSSDQPGYMPFPTQAQLRRIGGKHLNPKSDIFAGEYAMERIYSDRYEGDEREGTYVPDEDELASMAEFPDSADDEHSMHFRPLRWEWINEPDPFGEDFDKWEEKEARRVR